MSRNLLASLDAKEEIVLRQIAHGSVAVDRRIAERLVRLALVERAAGGLRLTPLGRLRFEGLPKAPLLARPRSGDIISGYVSAVIGQAQERVRRAGIGATATPDAPAQGPPPVSDSRPRIEASRALPRDSGPEVPPGAAALR